MFWAVIIAVVIFLGFVVYQVKNAALAALKMDVAKLLALLEKTAIVPAETVASKDFATAIAEVKKHL